jgi:hypothetical protein
LLAAATQYGVDVDALRRIYKAEMTADAMDASVEVDADAAT